MRQSAHELPKNKNCLHRYIQFRYNAETIVCCDCGEDVLPVTITRNKDNCIVVTLPPLPWEKEND